MSAQEQLSHSGSALGVKSATTLVTDPFLARLLGVMISPSPTKSESGVMDSSLCFTQCEKQRTPKCDFARDEVRVTAFERKMRGGCQASLVRASDGRRYILKMMGNPQGDHTLFNEGFGSELARLLSLPVQPWRPLYVSDTFLEHNPGVWFEGSNGAGRIRPNAGIHFGSEFIEPQQGAGIFDMVPTAWVPRIQNGSEFLGMLVFDWWANHSDRRQAILVQQRGSDALTAVFIDHGQLFGKWEGPEKMRRCAYWDHSVYPAADRSHLLTTWANRIASLAQHKLRTASATIPAAWQPRISREELLAELQRRQMDLVKESEMMTAFLDSDSLSPRKSFDPVPVPHLPANSTTLERLP